MSLSDILPPPADSAFAGTLDFSPVMLGHLLRLPEGQEITEVRVGPHSQLALRVVGKGLPPLGPDGAPQYVTLMCKQEVRPGDVKKGGMQRRTICWWAHDPGRSWVQSDWSGLP